MKFVNENVIDLNLNLLVHSKLISTDNNQVSGLCKNDTLMQYMHDYTLCSFSKEKIYSSQINNSMANIHEGVIGDKDYVGMSTDSSISYNLEVLKPNEEPKACFALCEGDEVEAVYAYCNLHGLWKKEL